MGFADAYLLKSAIRDPLTWSEPHPHLSITVTIPVFQESGLGRCLDSLWRCTLPGSLRAEVLILINAPAAAPDKVLEHNRDTYNEVMRWMRDHPHPSIQFYVLLDHTYTAKEAGVGISRKILMDEVVRRFSLVGNASGIIASMDADAVVEPNYLEELVKHFGLFPPEAIDLNVEGCSVYFEHPVSDEDLIRSGLEHGDSIKEQLPIGVFDAVTQYELHLRYYIQAVRSTGYPYAFHTVGSAFAVRVDVYCKEGGMNRRQGGEDFYFIQKIAQRGHYSDCVSTRVVPSPRPSGRVPFGTGPVVNKLIREGVELTTYDPQLFEMLRLFFSGMDRMFQESDPDHMFTEGDQDLMVPEDDQDNGISKESLSPVLVRFLESQQFENALREIRANSASLHAFRKRFWRWYNMFRIMKFLHFARENGYPDIPVVEAAKKLLDHFPSFKSEIQKGSLNAGELLQIYRKIDRSLDLS